MKETKAAEQALDLMSGLSVDQGSHVATVRAAAPKRRRRVIVESPLAGSARKNAAYARACMKDAIARGDAPLASHVLYALSGVLDDSVPEERTAGIECGLLWGEHAEATVAYVDLGISPGMRQGIAAAEKAGRPIEHRSLSQWVWPPPKEGA